MANYGLTKETLAQLKNLPDIEKHAHRETLLRPFFTICTENTSVQLRYFGLNSIGELLRNFSALNNQAQLSQDLRKIVLARRTDEDSTQIVRQGGLSRGFEQHAASLRNGLRMQAQTRPARATQPGRFCINPASLQNEAEQFKFIGFNIFGKTMMDAYLERTRIMHCAAKNASSIHLPTQNIEALVGITPEQVKFLLAQPVPLDMKANKFSTVSDFLQQANPEQRLAYYRQSDIGQQLFTAYLAIVETAKIIKNVLYNLPLEISQNTRRPAHG